MMRYGSAGHIQLEAAVASTAGLVRDINEDSYLVDLPGGLFIVADGLGGHSAGEVASQMATATIAEELARVGASEDQSPKDMLVRGIIAAHEAIRVVAGQNPAQAGMGTTVVTAWFLGGDTMWLAHVGDSRSYLLRGTELWRLTDDHTILNQALKVIKNTFDYNLENLPPRHVLSQALGASEYISPGIQSLEMQPGDRLLLCSDGLTDMIGDQDISALMQDGVDADDICLRLVSAANNHGGKDNCTVIVILVKDRPAADS